MSIWLPGLVPIELGSIKASLFYNKVTPPKHAPVFDKVKTLTSVLAVHWNALLFLDGKATSDER